MTNGVNFYAVLAGAVMGTSMVFLANSIGAPEDAGKEGPVPPKEGNIKLQVEQDQKRKDPKMLRVKILSDILASDKSWAEKEKAAKSLGTLQSRSGAHVLLTNLMSFTSELRLGPQMRAVIGKYPCALALVANGTNSVSPVIGYIQNSDREDARHVCWEVLRSIHGGADAIVLIKRRLRTKMGEDERTRLAAALEHLKGSGSGRSQEDERTSGDSGG